MVDDVDAIARLPDGRHIAHVALDHRHATRQRIRAMQIENADGVAALQQAAHENRAEKPGTTGHQSGAQMDIPCASTQAMLRRMPSSSETAGA